MCVQAYDTLLSADQLHHLFLSSALVFKKWTVHLQILVFNIWQIVFAAIPPSYDATIAAYFS